MSIILAMIEGTAVRPDAEDADAVNGHTIPALLAAHVSGLPGDALADRMGLPTDLKDELKAYVQGFPRTNTRGKTVTFDHLTAILILLEDGYVTLAEAHDELDWS